MSKEMNIYKVTYNSDYWVFVVALNYADVIEKMNNWQNPCEFEGVDKIEYFGKFKNDDIFVLYKEPLVYTDEKVINSNNKSELVLTAGEPIKEHIKKLIKDILKEK